MKYAQHNCELDQITIFQTGNFLFSNENVFGLYFECYEKLIYGALLGYEY